MRSRPWWRSKVGLSRVVLATAALAPSTGAGDEGDGRALPSVTLTSLQQLISSIPPPPEPPQPPAWLLDPEATPAHGETGAAPSDAAATGETGEPDSPWEAEEAIFDDPRAEVVANLALEIPVSPYPLVINAPVEASIDYFTARERERFGIWIGRSGRYLGMIQGVLRERGLPEELAYTAMVESGFNARAVSRVGAKGLWQFMAGTARQYGLVVNRWVDERFDPIKSTLAAAQYLSDLHGTFGHWFLAQAAYNAGEARVARAIRRAKTNDFWALTQTRHLPNETKRFVPQILAATVITQDPARYGFEVTPEPPLAYEEVTVKRTVDLESVAALIGVSPAELHTLNPALRAGITPPFGEYTLRVPAGSGARLEAALGEAESSALPSWGHHRVRRGQSLGWIARLYQISPKRLAEVNQLRGGRLRGVRDLVVPVSNKIEAKTAPPDRVVARGYKARPDGGTPSNGQAREVVVRRGDTLWGIATRNGLEARTLAHLNGRDPDAPLYPGERLTVPAP